VWEEGAEKIVGHVARMGEMEMFTTFWLKHLKERNHLENVGIDGSKY
jgi:hypothetical protein